MMAVMKLGAKVITVIVMIAEAEEKEEKSLGHSADSATRACYTKMPPRT